MNKIITISREFGSGVRKRDFKSENSIIRTFFI